jgi:hypothetical protein
MMAERIRKYFISLGLDPKAAKELHQKYVRISDFLPFFPERASLRSY